jgi:hypothetical protein
MKMDKDTLMKNRFWIGVGSFVLLWLVIVIVDFAWGDEDKEKKKFDNALKGVKTALQRGPKTVAHQKPWNDRKKEFEKLKNVAWVKGWRGQEKDPSGEGRPPLFSWPQGMTAPKGPTQPIDLDARAQYQTRRYKQQFDELDKEQQKLEEQRRIAPVELAGGFAAVVPMQTWTGPPTTEELWLAQEEFCVRRELLYALRDVGKAAARMKVQEVKEGLPKGADAHYVARNANWELHLVVGKDAKGAYRLTPESKIKNVHPSMQAQALANPRTGNVLSFRLWQKGGMDVELPVSGNPVPYGEDRPLETKELKAWSNFNPSRPLYVEQALEWESSPVRRVEALDLAVQSHRTVTTPLRAREDLKTLDKAEAGEAGTGPATTGSPPTTGATVPPGKPPVPPVLGKPPTPVGPGATPPGPPGPAATPADVTRVNTLPRERYLVVTPECRHLPIALRLIVDQGHLHEVLGEVVNSRLRVQITQVELRRAYDVKAPGLGGKDGKDDKGPSGPLVRPFPDRGPRKGEGRVFPPPPPRPAPVPVGPGMGEEGRHAVTQADDPAALYEVTIYGIASLYDRPPDELLRKP